MKFLIIDLGQHVQPQFHVPILNQETQHILENTYGRNQFYMQHPWTVVNGRYIPYPTTWTIRPSPTNYGDTFYASSHGHQVHNNINNAWNQHKFRQGSYYHHHNFDFKETQSSTNSGFLYNTKLNDLSGSPNKHSEQNTEDKFLPKNDTNIQKETTMVHHIVGDEKIPKTTQKPSNTINVLYKENSAPVNRHPIDIGRGDIGAEDTSIYEANHYKSPEEIEALSLTKDEQNTFKEPLNLSVTGINKQSEPVNKLSSVIEQAEQQLTQQLQNFEDLNWEQEAQNVEQLSIGQPKEPLQQNNEKFENLAQKSVDQSHSFEQQNMKTLEYSEEKNFRLNDYREQIQMPADKYGHENPQTSSKSFETNQKNEEVQTKENLSQNVELPKSAEDISAPIEPSTEKPGFWSNVWNKTKSAKESVVSWFRS